MAKLSKLIEEDRGWFIVMAVCTISLPILFSTNNPDLWKMGAFIGIMVGFGWFGVICALLTPDGEG